MTASQIAYYRRCLESDPKAFSQGVRSFCKYAESEYNEKSLWSRIRPWVIALGIGGLGLSEVLAWNRHAKRTKNPYGPIKGPISEFAKFMYEGTHPGTKAYFPGQDGYDKALAQEKRFREVGRD